MCSSDLQANAVAVIAVAPRNAMFDPSAVFYMDKIATGPEAAGVIDINAPIAENIRVVAKAKGLKVADVTVVILDRPRHVDIARQVREAGARIRFVSDGDVAGAVMTGLPGTGVDLLVGIGGTPEGIIAAAAMKCMGGEIQGRLHASTDLERARAHDAGHDLSRVLTTSDLVKGDEAYFSATGITDGELVRGVRYEHGAILTSTVVMRAKSGTIRTVESRHRPEKLGEYAAVDFDRNT